MIINKKTAKNTFHGIRTVSTEDADFSASSTTLKLWKDHIPLNKGDVFPPEQMRDNATINKTFQYLVSGKLGDVLGEYIEDLTDMDPSATIPNMHIVANLGIFNMLCKDWNLFLSRCFEAIKVRGVEDKKLYENYIQPCIEKIVANMFTCCDRATVTIALPDGRKRIKVYSDKNIMLFRTSTDERVVTITNLVLDDNGQAEQLECTSYLPDGTVEYDLFECTGGIIGEHIEHKENITNTAVEFATNGSVYSEDIEFGMPELLNCVAPTIGSIRAFNTLTTLVEYAKELTRVVPDDAKETEDFYDTTTYYKGGTIGYNSSDPNEKHDVLYAAPKVDFDGAIHVLEEMLKSVSMYSGLSGVILGTQNISGADSGKAILLACIPTISNANGYLRHLTREVRNIVFNLLSLTDKDLSIDDIELVMNSPKNVLNSLISIDEVYNGRSTDVLTNGQNKQTEEENDTQGTGTEDLAEKSQTVE